MKTFKAAGNTFYISPALKTLVCRGSANSETVCFRLKRFAGKADLAECGCAVKTKNSQGAADITIPEVSADEQELRVLWTISSRTTSAAGILLVQLQFEKSCDDSSKAVNWQSNIMEFEIPESLDAAETVINQEPTVFSQWAKKIDALCAAAAASAAAAQQKADAFSGYTKEQIDSGFANVFLGRCSGKSITLDDILPNSQLRSLRTFGQTVQSEAADPAPDKKCTIRGTSALQLSDGGTFARTIFLPQELYSLPGGITDDYDAVNGVGTQRIGKLIADGTQTLLYYYQHDSMCDFTIAVSAIGVAGSKNVISDRFTTNPASAFGYVSGVVNTGCGIFIRNMPDSYFGITSSDTDNQAKAKVNIWLAANPVTVLYPLDREQPFQGTGEKVSVAFPCLELSACEGGTLSVVYARDSNSAYRELLNRIAALQK